MEWDEFVDKVKFILRRFNKEFNIDYSEDSISYIVGEKSFEFSKSDYNNISNDAMKSDLSQFTVSNNNSYEVIIYQTNKMIRRLLPYKFEERIISTNIKDSMNNIEYKFQEISDVMVWNIIKEIDLESLKRTFMIFPPRLREDEGENFFNLLRVCFRNPYSLIVSYNKDIDKKKLPLIFIVTLAKTLGDNNVSISKRDNVVLSFPYKDCILEMDSTEETEKRKEVFFNETLMKKEIDTLLSPKVFANVKRISKNGEETTIDIHSDNLIIKGNNLLSMYSLVPRYKGKIKCMYWDVLYNKEKDYVPYNDSFKHTSWLTMMKNRLEVAHKLLSSDGSIWIQCDDNEMHYLKVLLDEIFERDNYVNTISVTMKNVAGASSGGEDKRFKKNIEYILVYAKDYNGLKQFSEVCDYIEMPEIIEMYKQEKKSWKYTSVLINPGEKEYIGSTVDGSGDEIKVYRRNNQFINLSNK